MLKVNDKVIVHMFDTCNREIKTRNYGTVFEVREVNGKLGIDWNTEKTPSTCNGDVFTPFETFAPIVLFENIENEKMYYWSTIKNRIVEMEV